MLLLKMHRWEYVLLKGTCLKSRRYLSLQSRVIFSAVPFQAYLQDDGDLDSSSERNMVLQAQWNISGFVSSAAIFLCCLPLGKSGHLWRKCELEYGTGNLWKINHEVLAREVLWDPSGLHNRAGALLGCFKDHYFVKFQKTSNNTDSKVRCALCAVMFVIFLEKPQCKENLFPSLKWNCDWKTVWWEKHGAKLYQVKVFSVLELASEPPKYFKGSSVLQTPQNSPICNWNRWTFQYLQV